MSHGPDGAILIAQVLRIGGLGRELCMYARDISASRHRHGMSLFSLRSPGL